LRGAVHREWGVAPHRKRTQVVDAVRMIGVIVRNQEPIKPSDLRVEQLLAQVG
jgi:hypothetical protein